MSKEFFLNHTLGRVRTPLKENLCHFKYVLVTGRANETNGNPERRRLVGGYESDDFNHLSYDSLLHLEQNPSSRYIGVLRVGGVDLVSEAWAGESIFAWVPPEQLRITDGLRSACFANRARWRSRDQNLNDYVLDKRLPLIGSVDASSYGQLVAAAGQLGLPLP